MSAPSNATPLGSEPTGYVARSVPSEPLILTTVLLPARNPNTCAVIGDTGRIWSNRVDILRSIVWSQFCNRPVTEVGDPDVAAVEGSSQGKVPHSEFSDRVGTIPPKQ